MVLTLAAYLRNRHLVVWLGGKAERGAIPPDELVSLFARAKAWPNLRELTLFDPSNTADPGHFVSLANNAAGRQFARLIHASDGRLPFAPDFALFCPGQFPDGRCCVTKPIGQNLHILVFGANHHVATAYDIPLTEPVAREKCARLHSFGGTELVAQEGRAKIHSLVGSVPAFIRVFPFCWPDNQDRVWRDPSYHGGWSNFGVPEPPGSNAYREAKGGFGGAIDEELHYGWFRCAAGWCGKTGQIAL